MIWSASSRLGTEPIHSCAPLRPAAAAGVGDIVETRACVSRGDVSAASASPPRVSAGRLCNEKLIHLSVVRFSMSAC